MDRQIVLDPSLTCNLTNLRVIMGTPNSPPLLSNISLCGENDE